MSFEAWEHREDGGFDRVRLALEGSAASGWQIERNGAPHRRLGPGYRRLRVRACGVCATDLARRFLPFPLPQVIGHEVLAEDEAGGRCVVEINASCQARGVPPCATCRAGLERHCPDRLVLGIHDLPGGFGPFVLAPVNAIVPVPDALPDDTAVLAEPFAAALHAVRSTRWRHGDRAAVLGARRLGMLIVAALAAERRRIGTIGEIVAVVRRSELGELARTLGADAVHVAVPGEPLPQAFADVVFDTTGSPDGLAAAIAGARREVHLKSTHGQPAGGLRHPTEMVVDELGMRRLEGDPPRGVVAWLAQAPAPPNAEAGRAAALLARLGPGAAEAAVVADAAQVDEAVRPDPEREVSLVRPRGELLVHPDAADADVPLLRQIASRGLVLRTSRCGDFGEAVALLASDPALAELGPRLVTHRFPADALTRAFETAASPEAVKVLVEHPVASPPG